MLQDFFLSFITTAVTTFLVSCFINGNLKDGFYIWKRFVFDYKERGIPGWVFLIGFAFVVCIGLEMRRIHELYYV